ncbi:MAG: hypothetical protein MOB07_06465 [Acidobacteria bacterium]|nr:hypothetical protein [Acidobacteriota bacterium]
MKKVLIAAALMALLAFDAHAQLKTEGKVASYEKVNPDQFNQSVKDAARNQEPWAASAISVALKMAWNGDDAKSTIVEVVKKSAEDPNAITIIVTHDGLMDDSTRAVKYKLELQKGADGVWQVTKASRARSCRTGRGHANYSSALCR